MNTDDDNEDDDDDDNNNNNNNNNNTEVKIGAAAKQTLRVVGGIGCFVIHRAISVKTSISLF